MQERLKVRQFNVGVSPPNGYFHLPEAQTARDFTNYAFGPGRKEVLSACNLINHAGSCLDFPSDDGRQHMEISASP